MNRAGSILVATGLLLVAGAAEALAGGRASSWVSVYADDDRLTVVSPQIAVRAELREGLDVDVGYDMDVITAASVDVVTAASPGATKSCDTA